MEVIFTLNDIDEAAKKVLALTTDYKVFAFYGEMGAGKTTFIHSVCIAMGVQDNVSSPTFSLINQYTTNKGVTVYHMDLYRLKDEKEAVNAGIEDSLFSGNICMVEWPEKAPAILPENALHIYITAIGTNTRKLSFELNGSNKVPFADGIHL